MWLSDIPIFRLLTGLWIVCESLLCVSCSMCFGKKWVFMCVLCNKRKYYIEDCEPMGKFGQIQEFELDNESFSMYIERLELFFEANDVPDGKRVPVLLSLTGAKNYALLRSLVAPSLPKDKSFVQLVTMLKIILSRSRLLSRNDFIFIVAISTWGSPLQILQQSWDECPLNVNSTPFWMKHREIASSVVSAMKAHKSA